jgi:Ca2+-binding RTX toxin-like protein
MGLLEADWDYGRMIHILAPSAIHHQASAASNAEAAPAFLWQQGVVSAADMTISADWAFRIHNDGTITNRLFLDLAAAGQVTDGRNAITDSSLSDEIVNADRIEGQINLGAGNDLLDGRLGLILGAADDADGDDTLPSGAAAGTLLGGFGQDWLDGGDGADSLNCRRRR